MAGLRKEHAAEVQRARDLENEVQEVERKLENCDIAFPREVQELKEQIESAKKKTQEYEAETATL
jgi:hypothetical protein